MRSVPLQTGDVSLHDSEFQTLAELSAAGIFRTDDNWRCVYVNAALSVQTGLRPEEALGDGWLRAVHPEDRERVSAAWKLASVTLSRFEQRFRFLRPSGDLCHVHAVSAPIYDGADRMVGYIGMTTDETEARRREMELAEINREMRARVQEAEDRNRELVVLHEMSDLLQSSLDDGDVRSVLDEFLPSLLPGTSGAVYLLVGSRNLVEANAWWGDREINTAFAPATCWALRRSALHCPRTESMRCAHLLGDHSAHVCVPMMAQGEMVGVITIKHPDRSEIVDALVLVKAAADQVALALSNLRLRESLRSQSIRDPLTGLFNRRYMEETFERELSRVRRENKTLSMLMLDLDHFKKYNDTHGHAGADQLLREFGALLLRSFRSEDIVCRFGGEEFVVILPGASAEEAEIRAECVRAATRNLAVRYQGSPLPATTVSIGVSQAFLHGESPEALLRAADEALYRSKEVGRDRVIVAGSWRRTNQLEVLAG
jgi:diguanylate cyclase (GGDEF)-like protein/PAS domain S-box-containing protein